MVPASALRAGVRNRLRGEDDAGVREGIEQARYAEAEREIARIAAALEREARLVDAAAADLESVPK